MVVVVCVAVGPIFVVATGGSPFASDLAAIVTLGVGAGALLQVMAGVIRPGPQEMKRRAKLEEGFVAEAVARGIDPREAARAHQKISRDVSETIARFMDKVIGLVVALGGGGLHGIMLFALGAGWFVGLGFDVSGAAVALFYALPVFLALADAVALFAFQMFVGRRAADRQAAWAAAASLPIALIAMVAKVLVIVAGAWLLQAVGGPEIDWRLYAEAATADPFGRGLTVTALLLTSLAWPLLLLIGPAGRILLQR